MANELSGAFLAPGDLAEVYTKTAIDIGTRMSDDAGNEYIFLIGVGSTVIGSWVTYDENGNTTLLAADAKGPVAIAMATTDADTEMGWYQIWGKAVGNGKSADEGTLADNVVVGRSAADGFVDDNPTAGDVIYGAFCRSAMESSTGNVTTTFQIMYPWVDDNTGAH